MTMQAGTTSGIRVIKGQSGAGSLGETPRMAGMIQQELLADQGRWIGVTRSPAGTTSPWHHHGDYDTYVYVLSGARRLEFGAAGAEACESDAGDLIVVPKGAVHREVNTGSEENVALIVRLGSGESFFTVDGPSA